MGKKKGKAGGASDGEQKGGPPQQQQDKSQKDVQSKKDKPIPGPSGDPGKQQPQTSKFEQQQGAWGGKTGQQSATSQHEQGAWGGKGTGQQKQQQQQAPRQQQQEQQQAPRQQQQAPRQQQQAPRQQQQEQQQAPRQQQQQQGPRQHQQEQQQPPRQQQQAPRQQQQAPRQQQQAPRQQQQEQQQAPRQQQQQKGPRQQQQEQQQAPRQQQQQAPQQQQQQQAPRLQQQQQPSMQASVQPAGRGRGRGISHEEPRKQPAGRGQKPISQQGIGDHPSSSVTSITTGTSELAIKSTSSSQSTPTRSTSSLSQRSDVSLSRGTRGRHFKVETNYLELILDKMIDFAYQYDIKFDPDKPKRFLRAAFIEYCKSVKIPTGALAFDGRANVFSPRQLGPQYVTTSEVKVVDAETGQEKDFKVTLTETQYSAIELKSLKNYQSERIFDKPMRALQCLDVILSSPCHQKGVRGGRSFYNPPTGQRIDLSESYELWLGLFQAAVLGDRPFLNIDISHRAFPSAEPLINVIQSLAGRNGHDMNKPLPQWLENALHDYLRGLVVIYIPPKCFNAVQKRFKFQNVKMASNRQEFSIDGGKKLTVDKYFSDKGYRLKYPNLPCLHIGNTIKTNYIPAELLEIAAGQLNLKKAGPRQVAQMIKYAATPTDVRKQKILGQFYYMQHNMDSTLKSFGVGVGKDFIKVDARVLDAPSLEYNRAKITPRNGSWNGADYIKPANVLEWCVLNLDDYIHENQARDFGNMISSNGRKLNMNISDKFMVFKIRDNQLEDQLRKFKQENKSIVFVILSGRNQNSYSKVKQNAEIRYGVLTQCIKSDTIARRLNQATIQNILLKVNAKLNGLNHRIHSDASTIIMKNKNVMFVGADVTHPTPDQRSIPSVVGVAASHDLDGFQYNMQWRLQEPTKEIIEHMQNITLHHLNVYEKFNKKLPEVILYYRDGVSEGQFPDITNTELRAMDAAFSKKNPSYRPKLTCLIVQKRHHTRFFPDKRDSVGRYNNVPPGTCVDQTITHPNECQFFLVSHESIQGTAKPTKYSVLRDDSHFNIDDLQAITYNMCHMFARCNRSVSYPAPAYYAHHVASRGKIYIEGQNLNMKELQNETKKREIKNDIIGLHPMFFV